MAALFKIERTIAGEPRKKKEATRDKKSRPIVRDFFNWCLAERDLVLDDSPMDAAIGYAINQQKALERFLDDGRLPMTNNISERNLRKEAVGRKNWIFVGSEDGATANTTFVSLIASCELHGIEPWRYLRDLFYLLPDWPKSRVLELAPAYFEQTLQQEEAKGPRKAKSVALAAEPSRLASLLLSYIPAVCAFVALRQPGASTAIIDRLSHSRALSGGSPRTRSAALSWLSLAELPIAQALYAAAVPRVRTRLPERIRR